MRYLIQLAIPALILIVTVLILTRKRNTTPVSSDEADSGHNTGSDKGMFFLILLIGAAVALTSFFVIGNLGI